ncbi:hypothetical protein O181_038138 [Austropuccinia psidii MF-1]|uniref:Uncharacterized protein n=1 Tax=Austropuccinia psidii MF-1 TaxID=1389203 RepID=A0A9Q3DAU9_9BASI|nr:hypothetical protein [Austropuccinia psidii MF-1]
MTVDFRRHARRGGQERLTDSPWRRDRCGLLLHAHGQAHGSNSHRETDHEAWTSCVKLCGYVHATDTSSSAEALPPRSRQARCSPPGSFDRARVVSDDRVAVLERDRSSSVRTKTIDKPGRETQSLLAWSLETSLISSNLPSSAQMVAQLRCLNGARLVWPRLDWILWLGTKTTLRGRRLSWWMMESRAPYSWVNENSPKQAPSTQRHQSHKAKASRLQ